jgi:hypothetical protein
MRLVCLQADEFVDRTTYTNFWLHVNNYTKPKILNMV